ncbi:MAG: OsmC-like protein [bacterium ADurb.Bin429]|nr:MAG: OsmC-like protein [bacterium ADurb.Bin429]
MADATFSVEAHSLTTARVDVKARNFIFTIDEPPDLGGSDMGPNPVEYILGGLAGCLNVMGHLIAQEMGLTISSMTIHIEGRLDPMSLLGKAPGVRPGFQDIRARYELVTNATSEQLEEWRNTVEARCPVSDNLSNTTPVHITWTTQ